jgi:hypothetical protein
MASLAFPLFEINLSEEEGFLAVSEIESHYSYPSKPDVPYYEIVDMTPLEQEDIFAKEESFAISVLIENILKHFHILGAKIESPKVFSYLYRYPDIAILAGFVSEQVYTIFDYNAQLCLNIIGDDDPDSEYLALFLRVSNYNDDVMDKIVRIQESYYDLLSQMTGWFLFTTDFALPR